MDAAADHTWNGVEPLRDLRYATRREPLSLQRTCSLSRRTSKDLTQRAEGAAGGESETAAAFTAEAQRRAYRHRLRSHITTC